MARDAFFIFGTQLVCGQDRAAAAMAEFMWAFHQSVAHRHTVVENKTIAFPAAGFFRDLFEIPQDSAFQMIDILDPLSQ